MLFQLKKILLRKGFYNNSQRVSYLKIWATQVINKSTKSTFIESLPTFRYIIC